MIPCIHQGEKTQMKIKFLGKLQDVNACDDCVSVIKSSIICEVLS